MTHDDVDEVASPLRLADIQTTWRRLNDPLRFMMIYGPALRSYLLAILRRARDEQGVDDVMQDMLIKVAEKGFPAFDPARGKFRNYLKEIVRNAALKRLRHRAGKERQTDMTVLEKLVQSVPDELETALKDDWRQCVLNQAWRALERHQREAGRGNLAFTVVRLSVDHPECDQRELALKAGGLSGQALTPEAFRKQLSRARRIFANLIVAEVQQTLDSATAAEVYEELADLGLLRYVADYLPTRDS